MFLHNSRGLIIVAAVVAVCGLAIAGFMHRSSSPDSASYAPAATQQPLFSPPYSQNPAPYPQQAAGSYQTQSPGSYSSPNVNRYPSQGNEVTSVSESGYASDGYYSSSQRPVYVRQSYAQPVATTYTENREYVEGPQYSAGPRRQVYRETTTYHRGRSKAHSVEIVAGTAAVGAAIGALAGGGKGAAIGAVSGGGAGFAYDRLTHNH